MRILKKLIIYATLIGVFLLSILVAFSFLYQDEIISGFTKELNKYLKAPIIPTRIEFSLVDDFPHGTITLHDVVGIEPISFSNHPDTLFKLSKFSFHFNVIQLYNSNFELENVTVTNGFCHLKVNAQGQENFAILETSESDTSGFLIALNKVRFNKVDLLYHDQTTTHKFHFFLDHITAKGVLSNDHINLALYGTSVVNRLVVDSTSFIEQEQIKLDVGVEIDVKNKLFQVSRGYLTLRDKYKFEAVGKNFSDGYDFIFNGHHLELAEIRKLVPQKYMPISYQYSFAGDADVTLLLKKNKKQKVPKVELDFNVANARFVNLMNQQILEIPKLKGSLDMGYLANASSAKLLIDDLKVKVNEGAINGSVQINNLKQPEYKVKLGGVADLQKISDVFAFSDFQMSGITSFDLNLQGVLSSLDTITNADIQKVVGQAKLSLSETKFKIAHLPLIEVDSGVLVMNQQKARLSGLVGKVDGANCSGWVWTDNWLNYILNAGNDLRIAGNIDLSHLYLSHWQSVPGSREEREPFAFAKHIYLEATTSIGELTIMENELNEVKANVELNPNKLILQNISASAYEGRLAGDFSMTLDNQFIDYQSDCEIVSVKINDILDTYKNFGQKLITSEHLEGDLSFTGNLSFKSDRFLNIINSSLHLDGDVLMVNGFIHENKLLTDIPKEVKKDNILSIFINLTEFEKRLHHIKFDTIQNHITISNSRLIIPDMDIRSSAMEISLRGTHTFDNQMDYYLMFNLNEVLSRRKLETDEYGFIEDDKLGRRLVYLHMFSHKGELKVEVDKLGKKHRDNKLLFSDELNEAKGILKKELGFFKRDTAIKVVEEPQEEFEYEVDFGEFDTVKTKPLDKVDSNSIKEEKKKRLQIPKVKGKLKKSKEEEKKEFEEWEFDDDDY